MCEMQLSAYLSVSKNDIASPLGNRVPNCLKLVATLLMVAGVSACSNAGQEGNDEESNFEDPEQAALTPAPLLELQNSTELISSIPDVVSSEVLADSGLQVAYTSTDLVTAVPALFVEDNWAHMQTCLNQVAVAPFVVVANDVSPLTSLDDVIYSIEGVPVATSSAGNVPVIQITAADFTAGSSAGSNLRSIMGRLVWSSAGLAVRDYPFECARQVVELK